MILIVRPRSSKIVGYVMHPLYNMSKAIPLMCIHYTVGDRQTRVDYELDAVGFLCLFREKINRMTERCLGRELK